MAPANRFLARTLCTPAAQRAVRQLLARKPVVQPSRASYTKAKEAARDAGEAYRSTVDLLNNTNDRIASLHKDARERDHNSAGLFRLALKLEAMKSVKRSRNAAEKVAALQEEVATLRARQASAETQKDNHETALIQRCARYEEDERTLRHPTFDHRVSVRVHENARAQVGRHIREAGAFDMAALRWLEDQLEELASSLELLPPGTEIHLSPEGEERARAAGRATAEAVIRSMREGLDKINNDNSGESGGTAVLQQMTASELPEDLAEKSKIVVKGAARLESLRFFQEG